MASPPITSHAYIASHPDLRNPSSSTSPVPSLYSSLSSLRTTNPSAYHANAKWWSSTLHDWAWKGVQSQSSSSSSSPPARLVLAVDATLVDAFTLNDDAARPTAIPTAVAAMIKAGELIPLKAYLAAKEPIRKGAKLSASSVASSSSSLLPSPRQVLSFTVARPFWFAMRMAGLSSNEDDDDDDHAAGQCDEDEDWPRVTGSWVSLSNLEKVTSLVLSQASAQVPSSCPLLSMAAFRSLVRQALPHLEAEVDYEVILKHLARDKRVAVVEGNVVKLWAEGDVQPITEEERSIFAVRETHARLTVQVADIEKRIEERTEEVKGILKTTTGSAQASSSSSNPRIRHLLSSRRALNDLLTRRLSSLSQLESVLLRIEQAHDDVTLLSAYEAADQALRGLHKQSGGAERAEEVMMRLEESVADQRDVEEAMRLGGVGVNGGEGQVDDEEELRREMERLEVEEKEDKEQRRLQQQQAEAQKAGAAQAAAAAAAARSEDAAAPKESTTPQQQPQADKPAAASQDASTNQATSAQQRQQQQQREPVLNE